jgi:cyclophilin family peptidyl-prolyl cis-trans isomerase/flagellar biogenesis protein FliO
VATQKRTRPNPRARNPRAAQLARRRKEEQRRRIAIVIVTAVVLVLGVSVIVSTSGGGGGNQTAETANSTSTAPARNPVSLAPVTAGATISGDTPCPKPDGSSPRTTSFAKPPPLCINVSRTYVAEVVTSKGRFTIQLDAKAAPNTVNNFVVLARYHFYDGIAFHRILPGFVVQGGDPMATGVGGPGYRFDDELPRSGSYKIGSVAMANSGPNSNGSQFFVVTGDAGINLPLQYSLFGTVTEGMDVVKAIEAVGTPPTAADPQGGRPTQVVTIQSITIKET